MSHLQQFIPQHLHLHADGAGARLDVAGSTFTDASSNNNSACDPVNWTFDGSVPTITSTTIAFDNSTIAVTFSEAVYNTTEAVAAHWNHQTLHYPSVAVQPP
jgi:hypothetical protein